MIPSKTTHEIWAMHDKQKLGYGFCGCHINPIEGESLGDVRWVRVEDYGDDTCAMCGYLRDKEIKKG